jgi:hypothetical protein
MVAARRVLPEDAPLNEASGTSDAPSVTGGDGEEAFLRSLGAVKPNQKIKMR